jgi:hypothetical protein
MKNVRIVKRTMPDGRFYYFYQVEKKFLWKRWWADYYDGWYARDLFYTLQEAEEHLWYVQEIKPIDEIIETTHESDT